MAIAGYLGSGDTFDHALADFAERYAQQNELDYERFLAAVHNGHLQAHDTRFKPEEHLVVQFFEFFGRLRFRWANGVLEEVTAP